MVGRTNKTKKKVDKMVTSSGTNGRKSSTRPKRVSTPRKASKKK